MIGEKQRRYIPQDAQAIFFLVLFLLIYFWPVTLMQSVWYSGDIVRLYLPFGVELSRALHAGRLPLWTPALQLGFPLLAESQVGALYPINLILFWLLPAHSALAYSILLHLVWASCGMFVCARQFGLRPTSALIAALAFSMNGFMLEHIIHPTIIATSSWLPWLIFLQDRFQQTRSQVWFGLTVLSLGVQFLIGSVQIAFFNILVWCLFGLFGGIVRYRCATLGGAILQTFLFLISEVILATGIAAIQLVPTAELIPYSVRGGIQSESFNTQYSLPFLFLGQFIFPFAPGEPSLANSEYWGYFGLGILILAILALWLQRDAQTIFLMVVALGALSLTLGDLNPAYTILSRLPLFNFFRVPARYLLVFIFATVLLSAIACNALVSRLSSSGKLSKGTIGWGIIWGALSLWVFSTVYTSSLQFWLDVWQILPLGLGIITIGMLVLAWRRKVALEMFSVVIIGLVIFDLASYAPAIIRGVSTIMPVSYVVTRPRSLLALDAASKPYRVLTDEGVYPSLPAIRNSLFPNLALMYDKESVNIFSPLAFGAHWAFQAEMTPMMLNLLNVRYFMVPLEPRGETKASTPDRALTLDILNNEEAIPPFVATSVRIASFTEHADQFSDGTLVGEIVVRRRDGQVEKFPLRLGIETADWDYDRKSAQHSRAPIAHSFPAFWRAFGRMFEGHTYLAQYDFASPCEVVGVSIRVLIPQVRLTIETMTLKDAKGDWISLASLTGKNDFSLVYMSDTVAVWENHNLLPRAFIVPCAQVDNDATSARLRDAGFDPYREVLLADMPFVRPPLVCIPTGRAQITNYQPERVEIRATTDQPAYLVLTDSWYPGWEARVDGQPVPIYRANILFRAVPIEAGTHDITFEYCPRSFVLGALISAISLCMILGILLWRLRKIQ